MGTLGKAVITFAADNVTFEGDVGKSVAIYERGIGRMKTIAASLKDALPSTLTAGGIAFFAKSIIDLGDETFKLSQKISISTERISELRVAAKDLTDEQFANGLRDWNRALVEASDGSSKMGRTLKALGVDIKAGPYESFRQFAEQFSRLPEEELRTAVAMEVLKKSGAEWIPILAGGAKGLDDAGQKARNLGLIITTDFGRQSAEFNDNLKLIIKSTQGWGIAIMRDLMPGLVEMTRNIEESAQRGQKWLGVWQEAKKLTLAGSSNAVPRGTPGILFEPGSMLASWADRQADLAFNPPRQTVTGKIRGAPAPARAVDASLFGAAAPDPEAVRKALAESDALQKRQIVALQQMEEKRKTLFNLNEQDIVLERIRTGTYKDFDVETKVRLLNMALEIDLRAQTIMRVQAQTAAGLAEAEAMQRSSEILSDYIVQNRASNDQIAFETGLLGKSQREQEQLNAVRQIDIDLIRRRAELAKSAGEDMVLFDRENAKLETEATRQRKSAIEGIKERQRVERDWSTGASQAFNDYLESATNTAEQTRGLFTDSIRGMEDALVDFVTTGKLDFKKLADSIIADIIRIAVQREVMAPLLKGIQGLGSGGATGGEADALASGVAPLAMGGIMTSRGSVPLHSYASGGIARSPQLAIFGEGRTPEAFVPLPDGRRIPVDLKGAGRSGGSTYYIDARNADAQGMAELRQMVARLDGSIEQRSVSAVAQARLRGGSFSSAFGSSR